MTTITTDWINRIDNRNAFESINWVYDGVYPHQCFTSIYATVPFGGGVIEIFTGNTVPYNLQSNPDYCEGGIDTEDTEGLDNALNNATFHVEIFDNDGEQIPCPITDPYSPTELHGSYLTPHQVGEVILHFQND